MREATYTINGVVLGADPYPITEPPKGFPSGAPIRTATTPKPRMHGAYGDVGYAGAMPLELGGLIYASGPNWAQSNARRDALIAACWVGVPTTLLISGDGVTRQMTVRSTGNGVDVVETNTYTHQVYRVTWEALDPRMFSTALHLAQVGLATASGGWTFPWTFDWVFGAVSSGGSISAPNAGSAPAPWVARFDGPLTNPSISHQEQGRTLTFQIVLAAGDFLVVDSAARTVLLGGTASRYSTLVTPNWFDLTPGANTIRFGATAGSGTLTFSYRDAWW